MISASGTMHGGFGEAPPGAPPHWLAYVRVDDADAVAERVQQHGGQVHHGPDDIPEVGRFAIFADPQGAVIAAHALKVKESDAPPAEGVFAWDELLTTDVEQAKAFYGAVFGWTTADMDMGEMGTYTLFKRADDQDAGGLMQKPAEDPSPPHWMTYLATPDVDATGEDLRGGDGHPGRRPHRRDRRSDGSRRRALPGAGLTTCLFRTCPLRRLYADEPD